MRSASYKQEWPLLRGAAVLAVVLCCTSASAQTGDDELSDMPRSERSASLELQIYPLHGGGEIRHDRYAGVVRRLDSDLKEVLRGKVPAEKPGLLESGRYLKYTTLVLSSNGTRLLVIHNDDLMHHPPGHKVMLLDVATLKPLAEWPLGDCSQPYRRLPRRAAQLTLVCQHSRPSAKPGGQPTFALVTLDLDRGDVVRWFPLEGGRHGQWFGPMFFGYVYDAALVTIEQRSGGCPSETAITAGGTTGEPAEYPELVLVIERRKGEARGEVWFVSADTTAAPRRVAALSATPTAAFVCGGGGRLLLHVTAEQAPAPPSGLLQAAAPTGRVVEVFDLFTGARIAR